MSSDRRGHERAGSLELDYGDDMADLDYDQWSAAQVAGNDAGQQPVASTSAARTANDTKPAIGAATTAAAATSSRPLAGPPAGNGLPVNPLTGQRPTIAMPASSTSTAGGASAPSSSSSGTQQGSLAHTAVFVGDMHWWTSDRDVVELTQLAGIHGVSVKDVSFAEHKVNGKSKGVCYVECHSPENAQRVKTYVENNDFQLKKMTATLAPGGASTAPFRTLPKEPSRGGGAPAPVPSGQVRIGNLTVRTPRPATTAYLEPHVGQNRRDQPPGTGPGAQLGGIRLGGFMPAPGTAGPGSYGQKGGASNYHQQQQNGGAGSAGPPLHMGMGMGLPMNPMMAGAQQQQQQQQNQQGGGAGVFNPAFMNAAGGGNPAAGGAGTFAFDPSAAFGMANFGMPMGMPGMGMGMPGMGAGGGGMPDFSQMNMMGMGMGGMWPFAQAGMSPFGAGTAGGMSPMSNLSGQGDGAGEGYETGGAKKRSRMDN